MAHRKLILFGKNSYIVTIPKDWVERNQLGKGSEVELEEVKESIIISPKNNNNNYKFKIKKIQVGESKRGVSRRIISAYINNYNIIELYGTGIKDFLDEIERTTQGLLALEIMEQTPRKVIVKDFLNTQDISMRDIIKRIDIIIRTMLSEVQNAIKNAEKMNLDKIDIDINRLFYVGVKLVKKVLDNPGLSKTLDISLNHTLFYWRVIDNLEKIGDQQKRVVREINNLPKECYSRKNIYKVYSMLVKEYLNVIKSIYNNDKDEADKVLSKKKEILSKCNNIPDVCDECKISNQKYKKITIIEIIEKLKRFENYISHLAKAIINKD